MGKDIFVLFCLGIRRDEEKETQNINVVGKRQLLEPEPVRTGTGLNWDRRELEPILPNR